MSCSIFGRKNINNYLQGLNQSIQQRYIDITCFHLPTTALLKIHMEPENDCLEKQCSTKPPFLNSNPYVLHSVIWLDLHREWGKESSSRSFPNGGGVILYRFHQLSALSSLSMASAAQQDMDTRILERRQRAAGTKNVFLDEDDLFFGGKDRLCWW